MVTKKLHLPIGIKVQGGPDCPHHEWGDLDTGRGFTKASVKNRSLLKLARCEPCATPLEGRARSCRSQWAINQQDADRAWGAVMGSSGRPGLSYPPPGNFSWLFQWGGVILIAGETVECLWVVQCITAMRHDNANWYIRAVCAAAGNRQQLTKFGLTGLGTFSQAEALA